MLPKGNLIANFAGQGWGALVGLAFVPVYIDRLGIEAYGLIGLYVVIQIWLSVLDLGMTPTMTRESARLGTGAHSAESIADLLRSIEVICFSIAAAVAAGLWLGSGWIAANWVTPQVLSERVVADALAVIAFVAAARFCEGIYRGALYGLERQVFYNVAYALLSTVRYGGAAVLVMFIPSVEAFFWWQAGLSVVTVAVLATATRSFLPKPIRRPRFSRQALRKIGAFAGGLSLTGIFALLFTQVDKMLLTRLVDLESFGRYMLAVALGGLFPVLVGPVASALFPRLTAAVATGNREAELHSFRAATQLAALLAAPALAVCILASGSVIVAWTGDHELAAEVGPLLAFIAIGGFSNAVLHVPYMLQLAHGWTTLSVRINLLGFLLLLPAAYFGTIKFGLMGAAAAWAGTNILVTLLCTLAMHRRLLIKEGPSFMQNAVVLPVATSLVVVGLIITLLPEQQGRLANLALVLAATAAAVTSCAAILPESRGLLLSLLSPSIKPHDANRVEDKEGSL